MQRRSFFIKKVMLYRLNIVLPLNLLKVKAIFCLAVLFLKLKKTVEILALYKKTPLKSTLIFNEKMLFITKKSNI